MNMPRRSVIVSGIPQTCKYFVGILSSHAIRRTPATPRGRARYAGDEAPHCP